MTETLGADLQTWANIAQIAGTLGIIAAIVGLFLAQGQLRASVEATEKQTEQLTASVKATRMQTLLALDDAFSRYRKLRDCIRLDTSWQPASDEESVYLRRYLSVLDRVALALHDDLIDPKTVETAYGTSLEHVARNVWVRDYVGGKPDVWPHLSKEINTRAEGTAPTSGHRSR